MTKPDDTIFALPHVRRAGGDAWKIEDFRRQSSTFRAHYEAIKGLRS